MKVCHDKATATQAYRMMPAINLVMRKSIRQVIAEAYLEGNEYVVDTVTTKACHDVINIYQKHKYKNTEAVIFKYGISLDPKSDVFATLSQYAHKVLNALGFIHGLNHLELMLTVQGPMLIEINPRIAGSEGYLSKLSVCSRGHDQISHFYKPAALFYIQNLNNYPYQAINASFKALKSYQDHKIYKNKYIKLVKSRTLFDTVRVVLLSHSSQAQLEADLQLLEENDRNGLLYA